MNSRVWEFDVIYIKDPEIALKNKDRDSVLRTVIALLVYNMFTEAYFLIEEAREAGIFTTEEEESYKGVLKDYYENCFNYYRFKPNWLSRVLRKVYRLIPFFPSKVWAKYMWVDYPNS